MDGFDVVMVGGATVDLFLKIDPSNPHVKFNEETNELSVHLGDKVVLDNSKITFGGNANNVAVGLKRLGFSTSLVAEIGNDEFADEILLNLQKENVDTSLVKRGDSPSSFSVILNFDKDRTIFTKKSEKKHDFDFSNLSTKWLYLTSLGNKWEETYKKVSEFIKTSNSKLAFNPGVAQIDCGLESFSYLLPQTEILILNLEEAQKLLGQKSIEELLSKLQSMGPKIVVITNGEEGSYSFDDTHRETRMQSIKVDVISKTGAGDAYSSGFLAGILRDKDIEEAMSWGTKNATSVIGKIGSQTGLLTKEEI